MIASNKKSIYDYSITLGAQGAGRLFALVITVLLARTLGTEDFGIYSLFFGIFILIFQANAGVNIAYVRFYKQNITDKRNVIRLSLIAQVFIGISLATLGLPISYLLSQIIGIDSILVPYLGFICSGMLGLYGIWFGICQSESNFIKLAAFTLSFNFILMLYIASYYLFDASYTLNNILYAYLIVSICLGIPSLIILWMKSVNHADTNVAKDFYKMISLNITVTLLYFMYRYVDVYFIKYYSDIESVGIYSAAMKTSMILNVLTGSLTTLLLPKAISAIRTRSHLSRYLLKAYLLTLAIVVCLIVFYWLSPYILELLFGNTYAGAGLILQWLVLGWIANTLYVPIAQLYYALNKVSLRIGLELLKLTCAVAGFVTLIPMYGAIGAAYALLIAIIITQIIASLLLHFLIKQFYNNESAN